MSVTVEILRETPPIYQDSGYPLETIVGRKYVLDEVTAAKLITRRLAKVVDE